jgi:hypothetical protein
LDVNASHGEFMVVSSAIRKLESKDMPVRRSPPSPGYGPGRGGRRRDMRMTSAIWLNVAAIVVVVGIWTFAVAHAHRALARDERGPAPAPLTAQRASDRARVPAAGSARDRRQARRQCNPAELAR